MGDLGNLSSISDYDIHMGHRECKAYIIDIEYRKETQQYE